MKANSTPAGYPKRPIRRHAYEAAANLQVLRNAASHHRNISHGVHPPGADRTQTPRIPLITVSDNGIELLSWMNPDLARLHSSSIKIADLIALRPTN